ncbi:MAG: trigger factor [Bacteroidetes bacterium]|nr:trigger factor [Bacteroidota bacterium]
MNISIDKLDDLNTTVIIDLEKQDYEENVEKELRKVQKNVAVKGFRPGKAPLGMVKKLYGRSILADEIQKKASDALNEYIQENKLDILGYPISSERVPSDIDIEGKENFKFAFDLGLAPALELNISAKDKLTNFQIEVGEKEIDEDIEYARKRYGKMEDVEVSEAEDIIYCNLTELNDEGVAFEGGIAEKPASLVANLIEDAALKQTLIGVSKAAKFQVNIFQLFNNNDTVISNTLGIQKEGVKDLNMNFELVVTDIKRRTMAEINEDYYKEVFGPEDFPANEEEYRARIKSNLENYYKNESDLWLDHEIGHLILDKHQMQLPDEFLKRWLVATKPEQYNAEDIEEKYAQERAALHRRLVVDKIAEAANIEPTEADIREEARIYYMGLYRQYGLTMMPDDNFLDNTINQRMGEREFVQQMADRVIYRKAYDAVKNMITLEPIKISVEDYFKHVNSHKHEHAE